MYAMILAAGYGTRLLPYTKYIPKPLFPIASQPILDITINKLINSNFKSIRINTHHLSDQIEKFIQKQRYKIPIKLFYEKNILETGGGIANMIDKQSLNPFLVINGDIITHIDLQDVYKYHLNHKYHVTMVMHDFAKFNNVIVENGFVKRFLKKNEHKEMFNLKNNNQLAFTGIHVCDPIVSEFIDKGKSSIIKAYEKMLKNNIKIKAYIVKNTYWNDIGSKSDYSIACINRFIEIYLKNNKLNNNKLFYKDFKSCVLPKIMFINGFFSLLKNKVVHNK